jgi:putative colanic acid biosynthesis acetyltransferase WcaF
VTRAPHNPEAPTDAAIAASTSEDAELDALLHRSQSPYTLRERILRVLWNYVGQKLFRFTFHNWYALRNAILRAFGATVGHPVRLRPTVLIEQPWNLTIGDNSSIGDRAIVYCLGKVTIGAHVSVSQGAHLCAGSHDFRKPDMPILKPIITIHDYAWVAADAFVGPGVTVGEGTVLGARGCAMKDLAPWTVYTGNPALRVKDRPRFK